MAATSTTDAVLSLLLRTNKPYSLQNVVDLLAHAGHKKAGITKALDTLTEAGTIIMKEFGKTKIWLPNQNNCQELSKEELEEKKRLLASLNVEVQQESEGVRRLEQELSMLRNSMPVADMKQEIEKLQTKLPALRAKLQELQGGAVLVTAEDRANAEKALKTNIEHWRKRKSMFRNIWDAVSEAMDGIKDKDAFDEMGVDTDEAVNANLKDLQALVAGQAKTAVHAAKRMRV